MKLFDEIIARMHESLSNRYYDKVFKSKIRMLDKKISRNPQQSVLLQYPRICTKSDVLWSDYVYTANNIPSNSYISPRVYSLLIEPTLNNKLMVASLKDKNFYEQFFIASMHPKTLLRRINGFYYTSSYQQISENELLSFLEPYDDFVVKSSLDSGSGKGIYFFVKSGNDYVCNNILFNNRFLMGYRDDFIIQERVLQHQMYSKFNPTSNNTLRVLTYRSIKDDSIHVLHTLLRIGGKGSLMDHDNLGGMSVSVQIDGKLSPVAYDGNGQQHKSSNGFVFSEQGEITHLEQLQNEAIQIASKSFYGRLLALDFTITPDNRILLFDLNCWRNGVTHYQLNNSTLFGEFTTEILDYCSIKPGFNIFKIGYPER